MLSKKNSMVTMVTDEFLENRIILQKSVATIGFIWFFWFQKCILLYIFAQVFLVMRSIRSHISLFRLGFTPTLIFPFRHKYTPYRPNCIKIFIWLLLCFFFSLCRWALVESKRYYSKLEPAQEKNCQWLSSSTHFHQSVISLWSNANLLCSIITVSSRLWKITVLLLSFG